MASILATNQDLDFGDEHDKGLASWRELDAALGKAGPRQQAEPHTPPPTPAPCSPPGEELEAYRTQAVAAFCGAVLLAKLYGMGGTLQHAEQGWCDVPAWRAPPRSCSIRRGDATD